MRRSIFPVFVGGVNGIGCNSLNLPSNEPLVQVDTFLQANTLVKRIERKMFDKGNSNYLYIVDFGSELDTPGFLSTDNGTDVVLVDMTILFLTFRFSNNSFFWIRTFLMMESRR